MHTREEFCDMIEQAIAALGYPSEPAGLYEPIRYTLASGGKRLRPTLLLGTYQACGGTDFKGVMSQALGIEMFHNFTLLHDDVMDRADMRRGRPTVHRRWGEASAILSGDAMLTMATQLIMGHYPGYQEGVAAPVEVLEMFNRTAMEIYQGQQYDMDFESRHDVSEAEYTEMIRLKTAVLLGCACAIGAIMAGADPAVVEKMYSYGQWLGKAFQLQDDYLDTFGDPAVFGKEIGGDIINEKKTWLWIKATEMAPQELERILKAGLSTFEKVEHVRSLYERLGLPSMAQAIMQDFEGKALNELQGAHLRGDGEAFFVEIANKALVRTH